MRILVVEDEVRLAQALEKIFKDEKYLVDVAYDGHDGLGYIINEEYDVIILDVMLPGINGFEIVKKMRAMQNATPVLILTAKDEISDKVKGLDCGADDYMTKPFEAEELLARVRALSRRQGEILIDEIAFSDIILNLSTNNLHCGEKFVHLGFKEFEVMQILMQNAKIITPKESLIIKVWGTESGAEDNNVEAYISFLRKKLCYLNSKVEIETIRKVGYRLKGENY